jgi:hypothetical protein
MTQSSKREITLIKNQIIQKANSGTLNEILCWRIILIIHVRLVKQLLKCVFLII